MHFRHRIVFILLFGTILSLADLYLLMRFARVFSPLFLLGEIVLSAILGMALLKHSRLMLMGIFADRSRSNINLPITTIVYKAVLKILGAMLLIMPGFITDIIGSWFILSSKIPMDSSLQENPTVKYQPQQSDSSHKKGRIIDIPPSDEHH